MDWRERRSATTVTVLVTAVVLVAAMVLALRGAGAPQGGSDRVGLAADTGVTVSCPSVEAALADVDIPAAAQAGVDTELANLVRQIANVNARLAREPDQAASQAGDIAGKRNAVIQRIVLDIERVGGSAPDGLGELAECAIVGADGGAGADPAPPADDPGAEAPPADEGDDPPPADEGGAGAQTVSCPEVESALPDVPASAAAEVERNIALLQKQIDEADARLARLAVRPEGGPNFVRNAILGPLEDKRFATLDRIAIAIGRTAARPTNLGGLAPCTLASGTSGADPAPAVDDGADGGAAAGAQTVSCPEVESALPDVPASAAAEVERNIALLQKQIDEADARLARLAVRPEGGPNFVRNAILGPLEDKRFATLDRIAIAIGRTAARPTNLGGLAPCTVTG